MNQNENRNETEQAKYQTFAAVQSKKFDLVANVLHSLPAIRFIRKSDAPILITFLRVSVFIRLGRCLKCHWACVIFKEC